MFASEIVPNTLETTYLEMTSAKQFKPSFNQTDDIRVERMDTVDVNFYLYLYKSVGEKWRWRDRLQISRAELRRELDKSTTHVYVLYVHGAPAGYIELAQQGRSIEVAYFGLREEYIGRGLGKHLLSCGIQEAWQMGASRVWLHTCNLDGPYALSNYQKRGFKVYLREREPMPHRYL